jgi:uncharacterized membrane protein YccC
VGRSGDTHVDSLIHACTRLERSRIDTPAGLQAALLSFLVVVVSLAFDRQSYAIPLAIGVLFVGICDVPDANHIRLRSMLWGTLWCSLATFIGGVTAAMPVVHVAVAFVLAAACGFAIALGLRGGLIGTLTLVLFAIFAGAPVSTGVAIVDAGCVVIGGALTIVVTMAAWPLRRFYGVRRALSRTYRLLAETTQRGGLELAAPVVAVEALNTGTAITHAGFTGTTSQWFVGLLSDLERARLAFIGLLNQRRSHQDYVENVFEATSTATSAIAKAILRPRAVREARTSLAELERLFSMAPTSDLAVLVEELLNPLQDAVGRLENPWPLGRKSQIERVVSHAPSLRARLQAHLSISDGACEHALRLAIAFGVATLASVSIPAEHTYWLPMTVAWVTRPDLAGTVNRVAMRVLGTIVGLLIFGAIAMLTTDPLVLAVVAAIAAYLLVAYIWANYPIAVVGVTIFVIALMQLSAGEPLVDMIARLIATLIAGVWVLFVTLFRPRRAGATLVSSLERTVIALRAYSDAVLSGGDRMSARAEVLRERTTALATVMTLGSEPRGMWERPGPRINVEEGGQIMEKIIDVTSLIVSEDLLREHGHQSAREWSEVEILLAELDQDIAALTL